jgi:aminoglycoside phosphotransferase (APT) family kinase protein
MPPVDHVAGIDIGALQAWMDSCDADLGDGPVTGVRLITGGTQNIVAEVTRGPRRMVVRRPPLHLREHSNATMVREARVLSALADTDVPHPRLLAACADPEVLGAAFYVMAYVDGFNPTVEMPELHRSNPDVQRRMGRSVVDAAAALGTVDHIAAGLGDLADVEGWTGRQVSRWRRQLESYSGVAGYEGPDLGEVEAVAEWLDRHQPTEWRPGIVHGDFHFANVLVDRRGPDVVAVVDWELATLGDPLLDLGNLLATWPLASGRSSVTVEASHLPGADEVVARYAARSGRAVRDVRWYQILACYRLSIILEGTHARACAGKAPADVGRRLHRLATGLMEQASRLRSAP